MSINNQDRQAILKMLHLPPDTPWKELTGKQRSEYMLAARKLKNSNGHTTTGQTSYPPTNTRSYEPDDEEEYYEDEELDEEEDTVPARTPTMVPLTQAVWIGSVASASTLILAFLLAALLYAGMKYKTVLTLHKENSEVKPEHE